VFTDIYHLGYLTESNAEAIEFYRSVFGAEVLSEAVSGDGKTKLAFLKVGNTEVEFIEAPERVRERGAGSIVLDHVGYLVPNMDAAMDELRAKGIRFASAAPNVNPRGHKVMYLDSATTLGVRMHLTEV
jgi:methylmalonyl-CoA/ethylmalonyl-CoA epimerase